jgi:hypothetical protein
MSRTAAVRGALVLLGILLLARGAWVAYTTIGSGDRIHVVIWLALGLVVHDGLLAPISVLLGHLALPHLPTTARWAARALLAWLGAVLIIGLPLVRQAPRRANPTVEIGHPFVGVCVAVGIGVVVVIAVQIALTVRRTRLDSRTD